MQTAIIKMRDNPSYNNHVAELKSEPKWEQTVSLGSRVKERRRNLQMQTCRGCA